MSSFRRSVGLLACVTTVLLSACSAESDGASETDIVVEEGGAAGTGGTSTGAGKGGTPSGGQAGGKAQAGAAGKASSAGSTAQGGSSAGGAAGGSEGGGASGSEAGGEGGSEAGGSSSAGQAGQGGGETGGKAQGGAGGSTGAAGKAGASSLPECDCFVKVSWCGTGVAKEAASKSCSVPLLPAHKGDLLGCSGDEWIVKDACEFGCNEAPSGTPDTCKPDPNAVCKIEPGTDGPILKWGLHPDASDALRKIGWKASAISQTIGNASASAGTHAQDGTAEGQPYSAATDMSVSGMTEAQIHKLLDDMARVGFVAWYRKPGFDGWPSSEAKHIHAIWMGDDMKLSLRDQVRDFMQGKNGLASHTTYKFHTWSQCWRDALWARYLKNNPAKG